MKSIIKILVLLLLTQSCKIDDECGECFSPPNQFVFELVDSTTGENLFTNGYFNSNDIRVLDANTQNNIEFSFIDENAINLISINTIGWKTETVNYSIIILNDNIFNLYVDAERLTADCCNYTKYNEIIIENKDFQLNQETGIYKILIE